MEDGGLENEKEDFDLSDDLDKSMELFTGMLKSKDDEIEMLNIKLLDIQKEFEFQIEKDKDFEVLQKLAEDEADAISKLEQENCKLTESLNFAEARVARDKEKWKMMEENVKRDKAEMKEKLNETIKEVELQKETYQQNETMMTELKDNILKLQEENLRLKDQVFANLSMFLSLYINIP